MFRAAPSIGRVAEHWGGEDRHLTPSLAQANRQRMRQLALTLTARVKENDLEPLRQVLGDREVVLRQALGGIGAIHYARWVIIEPGAGYKAVLAFESNFDGPTGTPVNDVIRGHIDDLAGALGPLLDDIYAHCEDYTPDAKSTYLSKMRRKEAAFYQGSPGRTVETIDRERALRGRLVRAVEARDWTGMSARQVHAAVR